MCRFAAYLGPPIRLSSLLTEPANSIIHQSYRAREMEEPLNGDGFGVAWYVPELSDEPAVFKDITPAWNNPNLLGLARVIESGSIFAHVRAATPGMDVSRRNCHPFSYGPFAFMHNGHLAGFPLLRRRLLAGLSDEAFGAIGGSTDSEHLFALFLDRYRSRDGADPAARLADALAATIGDAVALVREAGIAGTSLLNLAVTDGRRVAVSRYTDGDPAGARSLHLESGHHYVCEDGRFQRVAAPPGEGSVLIASEPLTADGGDWPQVPPNHLVVVDGERRVELRGL
jgi:glutamine amidotransferase